jgi:transposase
VVEPIEQLIKNESNPEVLREFSLFVLEQAKLISAENDRFRKEVARRDSARQEWLDSGLHAQLTKLRRRFFDHGREGLDVKKRDRRDEDQLLLHAQSLVSPSSEDQKSKLPGEETIHVAEAYDLVALAQKKDPELRLEWAEIEAIDGFFESSSEITVTERIYKRVTHNRQKYRVKNQKSGKATIVAAPGPLKLLPGCRYSVDFAVSVVNSKFLNHMPYERQRRDMKRAGLSVPVMTLYRLSEQVALHLEGVAEEIRQDIFQAQELAVHLDETRWPILSNHDDDGQMWILSNQAGSYYRFEPTRSGQIADELLKGFSGAVLTDKYSGYLHFRKEKTLRWGLCWAHARREFFDLLEAYPVEATKVVTLIDDLFDIERKASTWEDLARLRATESSKKLAEIKEVLHQIQATFFNRDDFCKAANYVLSAWKEFSAFETDLRLPLSNNSAERALRHAVLGRKNFNGSKTINGADVAATLYTVIESCKKVELDPVNYMKYVIRENQTDRKALTPLKYAKEKAMDPDGKRKAPDHEISILGSQ